MSAGQIAFLFGVSVAFAVYGWLAPVRDVDAQDDLDEPVLGRYAPGGVAAEGSFFERWVRPTIRNFAPQTPMSAVLSARNSPKVAERLVRSGNPWGVTPDEYATLQILAGLLGGAVFLFLAMTAIIPDVLPFYGWVVVGALLGAFIPRMLLDRERGKRRSEAQRRLPEALDLLVITMNSGQNFATALTEVVRRLPDGIMKVELRRVIADLRAGKSLEAALTDFSRRAPSEEVEAFCKSVVQAERGGADVSETLVAQSAAARRAYEALLTEKTNRLATTLMLPIIVFMLPALFLVILAPAFANIGEAF